MMHASSSQLRREREPFFVLAPEAYESAPPQNISEAEKESIYQNTILNTVPVYEKANLIFKLQMDVLIDKLKDMASIPTKAASLDEFLTRFSQFDFYKTNDKFYSTTKRLLEEICVRLSKDTISEQYKHSYIDDLCESAKHCVADVIIITDKIVRSLKSLNTPIAWAAELRLSILEQAVDHYCMRFSISLNLQVHVLLAFKQYAACDFGMNIPGQEVVQGIEDVFKNRVISPERENEAMLILQSFMAVNYNPETLCNHFVGCLRDILSPYRGRPLEHEDYHVIKRLLTPFMQHNLFIMRQWYNVNDELSSLSEDFWQEIPKYCNRFIQAEGMQVNLRIQQSLSPEIFKRLRGISKEGCYLHRAQIILFQHKSFMDPTEKALFCFKNQLVGLLLYGNISPINIRQALSIPCPDDTARIGKTLLEELIDQKKLFILQMLLIIGVLSEEQQNSRISETMSLREILLSFGGEPKEHFHNIS